MEDLMNTLILGATAAAAFPIAFLAARGCLVALVRMFPAKAPGAQMRGVSGPVL